MKASVSGALVTIQEKRNDIYCLWHPRIITVKIYTEHLSYPDTYLSLYDYVIYTYKHKINIVRDDIQV
jgi:hypothetical protein